MAFDGVESQMRTPDCVRQNLTAGALVHLHKTALHVIACIPLSLHSYAQQEDGMKLAITAKAAQYVAQVDLQDVPYAVHNLVARQTMGKKQATQRNSRMLVSPL